MEEFAPLQAITHFAALAANFDEGFQIIYEPYDEREPGISDPKLQLCCLDASIAIKPVFARFSTVIITSGTLSPLDMYPKLLECRPAVVSCHPSFPFSLTLSESPRPRRDTHSVLCESRSRNDRWSLCP